MSCILKFYYTFIAFQWYSVYIIGTLYLPIFLDAMQISFNLYNQPAKPLLAVLSKPGAPPDSTPPPVKDAALLS